MKNVQINTGCTASRSGGCILAGECSTLATQQQCSDKTVLNGILNAYKIFFVTTYSSNSLCGSFFGGYFAKKQYCVAPTATCSSYQGIKTTCQSFTLKSTKTDLALDTTTCQDITCSFNTIATSVSDCDSYHKGCLTKAQDVSRQCGGFQHDTLDLSVAGCEILKNRNGSYCYWTTGKACEERACTQIVFLVQML